MRITVTFDSMEEFLKHVSLNGSLRTTITPIEEPCEPVPAPEVPFEEDKPKEFKDTGTGAIRGATPEEQKQIEAEEKVKVETVRKLLADLNKKAGKNVAKDLIKELGFKRLTDVPEEKLPALQKKAEEVMAKYA